jgi:hypothetical protein
MACERCQQLLLAVVSGGSTTACTRSDQVYGLAREARCSVKLPARC